MLTEAIILAGGKGSRLRSEVSDVPKPMARISGKPFLEILIERFYQKGVNHFILSIGYMADVIIEHFKDKYNDIDISFSVEKKPLGTGGAVRLALTKTKTNKFLVLNGDTLFDIDIEEVPKLHDKDYSSIIFARIVEDVSRYGLIYHKHGCIQKYVEKGGGGKGCINGGVYVFSKHQFDNYAIGEPFSIESDFFPTITSCQNFGLIVSAAYFIDIGIPEDYHKAQKELLPFLT